MSAISLLAPTAMLTRETKEDSGTWTFAKAEFYFPNPTEQQQGKPLMGKRVPCNLTARTTTVPLSSPHHGVVPIVVDVDAADEPGNKKSDQCRTAGAGGGPATRRPHPSPASRAGACSAPGLRSCSKAHRLPPRFFFYFLSSLAHDSKDFP